MNLFGGVSGSGANRLNRRIARPCEDLAKFPGRISENFNVTAFGKGGTGGRGSRRAVFPWITFVPATRLGRSLALPKHLARQLGNVQLFDHHAIEKLGLQLFPLRRLTIQKALVRGANHDYLARATLKSLPTLGGTPFARTVYLTELQEHGDA